MLDLSTVSRHVAALEGEGLLLKSADPADKRACRVELTDAGVAHITQLWESRINSVRAILQDWPAEDVRTLTSLLARFVRDTEKERYK